ncbi:AsnC family transcriptional regulator [Streptomyces griseorubiginosus]|uniref:AsnC family transcriptional regulator n=1 Tax=Streptomyces griseorubiginosus TaxID=67304 RepID=UPI0033AA817C
MERLVTTGRARFTAQLVPEYLSEGLVVELAVRCQPGTLRDTAAALAARADTRSVEISTGAPEVFAELLLPDHDALLAAIDGSIGRIPGVVDIHSAVVLRLLLTANDWAPYGDGPTPTRRRLVEGTELPEPLVVDDLDRQLVALLERDARMPMARLAGELCVGESTARRRLARLMRSHILHLRLHIEPAALGFPVEARFQLTVKHRALDKAVRRLAQEPAIRHLVLPPAARTSSATPATVRLRTCTTSPPASSPNWKVSPGRRRRCCCAPTSAWASSPTARRD